MAKRLGHVLYWLFLGVAALAGWFLYANTNPLVFKNDPVLAWGFVAVFVGVPYLIGRASLYILAGE
jgi:hypothetical protein